MGVKMERREGGGDECGELRRPVRCWCYPLSVIRYPFTVYRSSQGMENKVLTHGSRSTVNGHHLDEIHQAKHVASSQQPEARSDLAPAAKVVIRYPFTVYRLPSVTSHDK